MLCKYFLKSIFSSSAVSLHSATQKHMCDICPVELHTHTHDVRLIVFTSLQGRETWTYQTCTDFSSARTLQVKITHTHAHELALSSARVY